MKVIYVAGPFRAGNPWGQEQNVRRAEEIALTLWQLGYAVVCPHTMTRFYQNSAPDAVWIDGTLELLRRCDGMVLCPGWESSRGTIGEVREAARLGLPYTEWPDLPCPSNS